MIRLLNYPIDKAALRRPGLPVDTEYLATEEFSTNLGKMQTILKKDGLGLAATQANWPIQMFLMCQDKDFKDIKPKPFINPKILSYSKDKDKQEEGCLSFDGLYLSIVRPKSIVWSYLELDGKEITVESEGYYARAIMHECDHLNGKLFFDYLTTAGKLKFSKWLRLQ
jgi:peptide deformylase